jgi:hypothetical protein
VLPTDALEHRSTGLYARLVNIAEDADDGVFALDFFAEVRVVAAPTPALAGRLGVVLGWARNGADDTESYAVAIDGESQVWTLSLHQLVPTGQSRPREDYYPGAPVQDQMR